MALNYLWIAFFIIGFLVACFKLVVLGDTEIFAKIMAGTMDKAKVSVEISLGLIGVMTLWLGLMNIGEKAGMIQILAKIVSPFFNRLFPEIPKNHPVIGSILMNFSANMLGLDNAATPLGLKAMKEMHELNPQKDTASNAQIMFLVLNTSGLTLIPISIMTYRAAENALDPSDVFIPILLATFFSSVVGLIAVAIYQKINLFDKVILAYLGGLLLFVGAIIAYFASIPQEQIKVISSVASNFILFGIIISFICLAVFRKVNVYDSFIEGAKGGFEVALTVIPYLVAMLVAIEVFRTSGVMDLIIDALSQIIVFLGLNSDFVPALPTALMKPLSGSGARGMMIDAMQKYGADSFVGRLACVFQGSTETTFYILAVYFGSVGIKNTRYSLICGLLADLAGILSAIFLAYLFFH
ncbi:MAG: hypothetical protein EAZ97_12030 [Bacteroidetes bacterium]|nr:MAG: hypothetical protein EAZ97_12030 [Bacteroidota bacterium]